MFSDPNCPYCNMFWKQARPWVESGKVQLRHIMVGMLRADSAGKSAALLSAKDPRAALNEHETLSLKNATHRVVRYLLTQLARVKDGSNSFELPMAKQLVAGHL